MKYKCLIVDDEALARKLLADYVDKTPELELVGMCTNAFDAKAILDKEEVDILFLDIHMEGLSGLDLLGVLKKQPATILTTAYPDYALESYEFDTVDYLLKPISFKRFYRGVTRAMGVFQKVSKIPEVNSSTISSKMDSGKPYFFVKVDYKIVKIRFDEVLYIESMREYVHIHTEHQKYLTLLTMSGLEKTLPKKQFARIHRSYIINVDKIETIHGNTVKLKEKELPISLSYKEAFWELIRQDGFM